ncbi:uncharacterized protein [Procambarus clarkii]|uniref:uncharacterized protein n=1 Tax=Procambarus clarkii TaxID=6728 RepID=UPI003743752B
MRHLPEHDDSSQNNDQQLHQPSSPSSAIQPHQSSHEVDSYRDLDVQHLQEEEENLHLKRLLHSPLESSDAFETQHQELQNELSSGIREDKSYHHIHKHLEHYHQHLKHSQTGYNLSDENLQQHRQHLHHQHHPHHQQHHHLQQHHYHQHRQERLKKSHRLQKRHQLLQQQQQQQQYRRLPHRRQQRPHLLQFTQSEYRQTVSEDVPPHTSILTVRATDGLREGQADIRYQLSDSTNFGIDEGGVIYNLRRLDFERTNGHYFLQVTAEDLESDRWGRNKAVVTANIQVTDAPEEPYFDSDHYDFSVSEFAPRGSYVGTLRANDDDEDLDYYFLEDVEPPNMFAVNGVTGVITLGWPPDGTQRHYTFTAGTLDHRGHVALVPVSVHIIGRYKLKLGPGTRLNWAPVQA